jgi:hypothetical protein
MRRWLRYCTADEYRLLPVGGTTAIRCYAPSPTPLSAPHIASSLADWRGRFLSPLALGKSREDYDLRVIRHP